jgi:hypothetical protein
MEKDDIDDRIISATRDFNNTLRNRQKNIDNPKKFKYYNEKLIVKEERLVLLLMTQRKLNNMEK